MPPKRVIGFDWQINVCRCLFIGVYIIKLVKVFPAVKGDAHSYFNNCGKSGNVHTKRTYLPDVLFSCTVETFKSFSE